jgi:hypothetical protein
MQRKKRNKPFSSTENTRFVKGGKDEKENQVIFDDSLAVLQGKHFVSKETTRRFGLTTIVLAIYAYVFLLVVALDHFQFQEVGFKGLQAFWTGKEVRPLLYSHHHSCVFDKDWKYSKAVNRNNNRRVDGENSGEPLFCLERAQNDLQQLTAIGPRVTGTFANDKVAVSFLVNRLKRIRKTLPANAHLEIDVQVSVCVLRFFTY